MSPVIIALFVLLGVGLLLALWLMGIYNGLVVAGNRFKNAFAQIDVQLKRRYELIPNLVEAVKGYMRHERETLDAVIKARNSAMAAEQKVAANPSDPAAMTELNQAEAQLGGTLGRLFALSEAYPDLKANQNMLSLQEELTATENKIGFARQAFNDAATKTITSGARSSRPPRWPACLVSRRRRCSRPQGRSAQRPRCRSSNPEPPTALCVPYSRFHAPKAALTMATNFFQQQDSARRKTFQLVVYFVLAILILIALVYGLLLAFSMYDAREPVSWWQPELLLLAAPGVGLLVGGASAFKVAQLASGG